MEWTAGLATLAEGLPEGWEGMNRDARFEERAITLRDCLMENGRTPRASSPRAEERSLANWLGKVRLADRGGDTSMVLNDRRRAALELYVTGWDSADGPTVT